MKWLDLFNLALYIFLSVFQYSREINKKAGGGVYMLEIRNLTKIYKSKGGVITKALDGVSIKFPSTGLVFLLGKSGSGKSTLLNVTGGLDRPDDGEIIIKGRNSKTFSGSDFDSYRNTFIGFIFQEYNILNEFNVEQNISLSLQLQGKKNDKEAVDKILESVDLKGFGKRKPNTLSGGQKQRIAIARALIKNPEIIMADEPTGALDSTTGKQVFDTLKKLSKEKLVIVVSHDRDFAEYYGDRIIELSDGKVISDVTKETVEAKELSENVEIINDNVISIKNAKDITKEEFDNIYKLLKESDGEVIISKDEKQLPLIKQAIHIRNDNKSEVFNETKEIEFIDYNGNETKFIKSRLPFKRAFKMGASSLKTKPVRMIFTIFLTLVALIMFGVASTLLLYDPNYSLSSGLANSANDYEAISKEYPYTVVYETYDNATFELDKDENQSSWTSTSHGHFSKEEINELNNNTVGHYFVGIFGYSSDGRVIRFRDKDLQSSDYYFIEGMNGFIDAKPSELEKSNISLSYGKAPKDTNEIAISTYVADSLMNASQDIYSYDDIVGKEFLMNIQTWNHSYDQNFKISGIYDCGMIPYKFDSLKNTADRDLANEFKGYLSYSYQLYCYVCEDFYGFYDFRDSLGGAFGCSTVGTNGKFATSNTNSPWEDESFNFIAPEYLEDNISNIHFYDLSLNEIEYKAPKDNEIYVSQNIYDDWVASRSQVLVNRIFEMKNTPEYSDSFKAFFDVEGNKNKINSILDDINNYGFNYSSFNLDRAYLKEIHDKYYSDWFYHLYLSDKLYLAFEEIQNEDRTDEIDNFYDLKEYCRYYREGYNRDDDYFTEHILNVFNSNSIYSDVLNNSYVRQVAQIIQDSINYGYYDSIPEELCFKYQEASNNYLVGISISNEDYNDLLSLAPKYLQYESYYYNNDFTNETKEEQKYRLDFEGEFKVYFNTQTDSYELKVLGITDRNSVISIKFFTSKAKLWEKTYLQYEKTNYKDEAGAKYNYVITRTSYTKDQIKQLLQEYDTYSFSMTNAVYMKVNMIVSMINTLKNVFLIIGIVFAVFASLMLFNFISSSISSKIHDIGILRAIGTRGSDLFKIFFSESGIIAVICFVVSIIASIIICFFINNNLSEGLGIKLLDFNILNAMIIVAGSVVIAVVGTFIPVFIASKKAPIASIRTL